ncbi:MFS transporter [Polynucleobacter sp.]|uniref:MFS transporter n=1 Tax=Polynucleobacter sp. TaxID=2029855 RepID=UPI0037CB7299
MNHGKLALNPFEKSPARSKLVSIRLVAATVSGNALEFYDFLAYSFFAVYIGKTFFPATSEYASLLLSVGVFGVGFLARPLGGFLIGGYADRVGRKPAMLLTIALITVGTLGLAITPSYESIGMAAPICVVICRLIQGLALGGEVGPSTAFLIEIAPPNKRGLYGAWQLASQGLAALLAGAIGMLLTTSLPSQEMQAWGWRVPFALGLLLIPVAIYLRRYMPETLQHGDIANGAAAQKMGLRKYRGIIALAILVIMGANVSTYVSHYMTTYAISTLHFAPTVALAATVAGGLATFIFAIIGGWLSDIYGRRPVMIIPRALIALLTYPAFLYLNTYPSTTSLLVITAFLAALIATSTSASISAIPELLPSHIRALGLSIAYSVSVAIFGGSTQLIITWLIGFTGDPTSPSWYVTIISLITLIAMYALPEGRDKMLNL